MGITCKMNGGKNLDEVSSQKIFSMGITCKLNWENLHVISSQKKIIWESLVKWTQIKFKGKSNERKREISKKEKKIEERKEKIGQSCTCCAWEGYLAFPVCSRPNSRCGVPGALR